MVIPLTPVRFFEYVEKIFQDKEGGVCEGERFTYGEFCRRSRKISNALAKIEVQRGDRVAYLGYNCHRLLELFYAPPIMGAILEPLNIRLAARDFDYIINESTPRVLFLDKDFIPIIDSIRDRVPSVESFLALEKSPGLPGWIQGNYEELLQGASAERTYPLGEYPFDEDDPAEIFYTSGTTGKPKGVMMTHRNLYLHALCAMSMMTVRETDIQIHLIPLFHVNGWGNEPHKKPAIEKMQKDMSYHILATFADAFRRGQNAFAEEQRLGDRQRALTGAAPGKMEWQGANLADLAPAEMEQLLANTVLKEFKIRLDRLGLEYQTPAAP